MWYRLIHRPKTPHLKCSDCSCEDTEKWDADTSASMNQRTFMGTTYLDVAKGAVEAFMKLRARDPASRGDRYMLVTLDDPPYGVKAGWKDDTDTFMCELKNLRAFGLTTLGHALRTAFDLLNLNRLVSGIDNYGQGRNPFFLEPSVIITITDGNKLTHSSGVPDELHLPLNSPLAGSELTKEPFRWDQRLFALVLRLPGAATAENEQLGCVPTDKSAITQMCEVTGGRSYCVRSQRMLNQCLESLVQKVQIGVVINFEKSAPDSPLFGEDNAVEASSSVSTSVPQLWHSCRKLIYVRPNPKTGWLFGHWPIPESFWPDQNSTSLPPRTAHPVVRFSCVDCEPIVIDKLPFDKYELEPSPLTQYILGRKSPHMCWQVFVSNSGKAGDPDKPFGYLKASTTLTCVNLIVMPYNYPVLLPLLDDLFKVHKLKANLPWRQAFETYLNAMPPYYILPLKNALRMMGAPYLIAEGGTDRGLSYCVISHLKKLSQQAKMESELVSASVGKKPPQETPTKVKSHMWRDQSVDSNLRDYVSFQMVLPSQDVKPQLYRNPYDVPRCILLDQLTRMRSNLLRTSQKLIRDQDEDYLHSVPVAQMGNYQEYVKMMPPPLRDIDINQVERQHTSGNPLKQDKKGPQNHNGGNWSDTNAEALLRRRQSVSPALCRPQTPMPRQKEIDDIVVVVESSGDEQQNLPKLVPPRTGVENSTMVVEANGDWFPGQHNLFKPISQHRGDEDSVLVVESNSDGVLGAESGEIWPTETDTVAGNPALLSLEGRVTLGAADRVEDTSRTEERLAPEDRSGKQPLEEKHICEHLNLQNQTDGSEADMETILIDPLDGSQVEARTRIMREIRKPGRNYKIILQLLQEVRGPVIVKMYLIQQAIKEASRFKKRVLIRHLKNFLADLEKKYTSSSQLPNGHG